MTEKKHFLEEIVHLARAVAVSPFTEFGRDAWDGVLSIIAFLAILIMSLSILATFPISLPVLVLFDRRNKRLIVERREAFAAKVREALQLENE